MSNSQATVIRASGVSKSYGIWESPQARLMHPIRGLARRLSPRPRDRAPTNGGRWAPREFHALRDVSFEVKKGESWGVIGVNGSGKSTLLKIIAGNLRPSAGMVEVEGKVAILDYGSGINGEFTGRENVYLKAAILGLSKREVDARFDSIAAFADIGDFMDQPVKTYSSGMGARLGFAIMAHVDADILITDEALAVGDAFFVQKCMRHIRGFLEHGTFLFVSHAISDVVALCDKAIWLDAGQVKAIGTAKDVTDAYLESAAAQMAREVLSRRGDDDADSEPTPAPTAGGAELAQPALANMADSKPARVVKDSRLDFLNRSPWRNDIEIPAFGEGQVKHGAGGARIENVSFEDKTGAVLSWIVGGEMVVLKIDVAADRDLDAPIVGFQIKDRLGQTLFADNTYLTTLDQPITVRAGQRIQAAFEFQMPLLPVGAYVIRAAIGLGDEAETALLDCIDDALVFNSVTSGARHGLVGVPMQRIGLRVIES